MPKFVPVTNPELARHEQDQVRTRPVAARRARATQRRVHPHNFLFFILSQLLGRGGRFGSVRCAISVRAQASVQAPVHAWGTHADLSGTAPASCLTACLALDPFDQDADMAKHRAWEQKQYVQENRTGDNQVPGVGSQSSIAFTRKVTVGPSAARTICLSNTHTHTHTHCGCRASRRGYATSRACGSRLPTTAPNLMLPTPRPSLRCHAQSTRVKSLHKLKTGSSHLFTLDLHPPVRSFPFTPCLSLSLPP